MVAFSYRHDATTVFFETAETPTIGKFNRPRNAAVRYR